MRYIYFNPAEVPTMVALLTDPSSQVSHVVIPANGKLELPGPFLDIYVPHKLQRVSENGQDISKLVLANRASAEAVSAVALAESAAAVEVVEEVAPEVQAEEPVKKATKKSAK